MQNTAVLLATSDDPLPLVRLRLNLSEGYAVSDVVAVTVSFEGATDSLTPRGLTNPDPDGDVLYELVRATVTFATIDTSPTLSGHTITLVNPQGAIPTFDGSLIAGDRARYQTAQPFGDTNLDASNFIDLNIGYVNTYGVGGRPEPAHHRDPRPARVDDQQHGP